MGYYAKSTESSDEAKDSDHTSYLLRFFKPSKCHFQNLSSPKRHQIKSTRDSLESKVYNCSYLRVYFMPQYSTLGNPLFPATVLFLKVLKHEGTLSRKCHSDWWRRHKLRYVQDKWKGWDLLRLFFLTSYSFLVRNKGRKDGGRVGVKEGKEGRREGKKEGRKEKRKKRRT